MGQESAAPLPPEVLRLINDSLASFHHVEVLLLLAGGAERTWSAAEVAAGLHMECDGANRVLEQLVTSGLLRHRSGAPGVGFNYEPHTDEQRAAVASLRLMFDTKPVTLIRALYARPPSAVKSFSEAFRVRGPEEDHG